MEEEEQLFLFQVSVENIVITDKSCLSPADGTDLIYVKILYPGLNWIELDQVDFYSLQQKPQPADKDSATVSASMNKVQSSQIFFSKHNVICNEGKSFLISMTPKVLRSHLATNHLQITLYQAVFIDEPWVIASHETKMREEMSVLVDEALRHPSLLDGPAAMDKQFPLNGAFGEVCGYLQCTICLSCAGATAEFGLRNACHVRDSESERTSCSTSEDRIVDVEKASIDTVLHVDAPVPLHSKHSKVARLLKAEDPFSYYKGEDEGRKNEKLERSNEYMPARLNPSEAAKRPMPNNNSLDCLSDSKTQISETTCDTCREDVCSSMDDVTGENSDNTMSDQRKLSTLKLSNILNEMIRASDKSQSVKPAKKPRRESSFSTISNITVPRVETKNKKRQKIKSEVGSGIRSNFERHTVANFEMRGRPKVVEASKLEKPLVRPQEAPHGRMDPVASEGLVCHMDSKEDFSLSIIKHASVYHVSIKNSANRLDNVLKFKIYGNANDVNRKRPRQKNSLSVTVIPTQRDS